MWYTNKETKQYREIRKKMFTIEITWWVGRIVFVCVDRTFRVNLNIFLYIYINMPGMSGDDDGGWTCFHASNGTGARN